MEVVRQMVRYMYTAKVSEQWKYVNTFSYRIIRYYKIL